MWNCMTWMRTCLFLHLVYFEVSEAPFSCTAMVYFCIKCLQWYLLFYFLTWGERKRSHHLLSPYITWYGERRTKLQEKKKSPKITHLSAGRVLWWCCSRKPSSGEGAGSVSPGAGRSRCAEEVTSRTLCSTPGTECKASGVETDPDLNQSICQTWSLLENTKLFFLSRCLGWIHFYCLGWTRLLRLRVWRCLFVNELLGEAGLAYKMGRECIFMQPLNGLSNSEMNDLFYWLLLYSIVSILCLKVREWYSHLWCL